MRTWIVLVGSLVMAAAPAQESSQRIDLESVAALVAVVASCAALHAAAADVLDNEGLLAHAETARRRAQADQVTAMHLLAEDRVAKGGPPLELTAYTAQVEQLTAAARERMTAIVTHTEASQFEREEENCASLIPLEDEVLAKVAADFGSAPGAFAATAMDGGSAAIAGRDLRPTAMDGGSAAIAGRDLRPTAIDGGSAAIAGRDLRPTAMDGGSAATAGAELRPTDQSSSSTRISTR
jgi:hypothetical protein